MKDKNGIIHCKTPQEFNRIIGVKTYHPLISVVNFSQIAEYSHPQGWKQDYYVIALCRGNSSCGVKYGRNMYDYSDGTLVFTSPGQTVVFQEYGEPFRPAEDNWAVMVHSDFIRGTALGRDIGNYVFFSYELQTRRGFLHSTPRNYLNERNWLKGPAKPVIMLMKDQTGY